VTAVPAARVLIAVPTLGRRPDYLRQALDSIRSQSVPADIIIVAPVEPHITSIAAHVGATIVPDPGSLPAAINAGIACATADHAYVNWLGDDDLLAPASLEATSELLDREPGAVVAYGACRYVDATGAELWVSRAGPWANRILGWGPDLIPQPGMLVRRTAWQQVGGLDTGYRFAFDLDLLLRLRRLGTLRDTGTVVSSFRWHPDSLTVGDRDTNLAESERAKRTAMSPTARRLAWAWEPLVRVAIRGAASEVNRRARRIQAATGAPRDDD
jgi:glycosyltransferase involved in cell wall biosynthesis